MLPSSVCYHTGRLQERAIHVCLALCVACVSCCGSRKGAHGGLCLTGLFPQGSTNTAHINREACGRHIRVLRSLVLDECAVEQVELRMSQESLQRCDERLRGALRERQDLEARLRRAASK